MVYQWRETAKRQGIAKADPNKVGKVIEKLAKKDEVATSAAIVDAARPATSPLHVLFEWDDAVAAEHFRREQARGVVQALEVVYEEKGGERRSAPAFYHVSYQPDANGEEPDRLIGYQPIEVVKSNPASARSAEEELLAQLEGLQRRYDALGLFSPVWQAVGQVKQKVEKEKAKAA